jgi:hypothetical protein
MKAKISLKLKGRNPLLMRTHGIKSLNPLSQCDMGTVHDSPYCHGKLLAAILAAKQPIPDLL